MTVIKGFERMDLGNNTQPDILFHRSTLFIGYSFLYAVISATISPSWYITPLPEENA
jgi:hypothetical protein